MEISEELQVYLWTRQVIDFRSAVKHNNGVSSTGDDADLQRMARNSSYTVDTDSHEGEVYSEDDTTNVVVNMVGKRVLSNLELVPNYNDEAFCHCLRMLLDGIQDQIEEHRARLARRQLQQQQQAQLPGHETDATVSGDASRHGSRRNESECYPEEEDRALCGMSTDHDKQSECEEIDTSNAAISFPEGH